MVIYLSLPICRELIPTTQRLNPDIANITDVPCLCLIMADIIPPSSTSADAALIPYCPGYGLFTEPRICRIAVPPLPLRDIPFGKSCVAERSITSNTGGTTVTIPDYFFPPCRSSQYPRPEIHRSLRGFSRLLAKFDSTGYRRLMVVYDPYISESECPSASD